MDIVTRAKNICLSPLTEWPIIAAEPATPGGLLIGYAAPLAAIGAVAGFIGGVVIGHTLPFVGHYRVPLVSGLITAIVTFGMALVGVFVLSLVINALAPTFGGEKNDLQALKVAVYSYTPAWIAGVLNISLLLAMLGIFAALYGLYLLYLGLPRLMKSPQDKALPYTIVVLICAIVISIVLAAATAMVAGAGMYGRTATTASSSGDVQFDKDSALGKLQDISKKMEDSARKGEAAAKSGDPNAQAAAAVEGLGALFGGGKRVDPISIEQLKPLVPDTLAGLPKTASSAEKTGFASLMVSKAEATYSDGAGKRVTLDISDTGGVSGIMALAGWASVQGEREDDTGSERTQRIDGRLTHEKTSKNGGTNEYAIVIADRFVVSVTGRGVDLATLKTAVSGIDIAKLESMKDTGVTK
ncbi:MAG: Yip1 family protein [Vicinamibacterales bacterium]